MAFIPNMFFFFVFLVPHPKPQTPENSISKNEEINYDRNYAVELGAPLLLPLQDEVTLEANTDFVLRCESSEAILWRYPIESVVLEDVYIPDDPTRPFGLTLTLKSVSYRSVGYYFCIKESSDDITNLMKIDDSALTDLANNNLASSIYVFVNGTNFSSSKEVTEPNFYMFTC